MKMTLDEHFKKNMSTLKNIDEIIKQNKTVGGPYVWTHEICALEKGLYKPKGLLQLPFAIENSEDSLQMYAYFDKRFITGEGVIDPESPAYGRCMDITSWENQVDKNNFSFNIKVLDINNGDVLTGVNTLMQKYFTLRKNLKSSPVHEHVSIQSYKLVMNCFTAYK
jgi:hypothetical protein